MTGPDPQAPPRYGDGGAAFVMGTPAPAPAAAEEPAGGAVPAAGQPAGLPAVTGPAAAAGTAQAPGAASMRYAAVAGTAAAAATTRPAAAAQPAAAVVPQGPPPGTVYGGRHSAAEVAPPAADRPHRLRIGSHTASYATVAQLGIPSHGAGLILGADRDRQPVQIRLFRPEPTRVALVGEVWAAQLLAFRSLALGARIVVVTVEPDRWNGLGVWATGRTDRVAVLPGETPLDAGGTAQQPTLLLYDLGTAGPVAPPALGPWQTQLTLLRHLDPRGLPALQATNLVMLKRLTEPEASLAAGALRLSDESARLAQVMENEMIALLGGGADRYVWLTLTSVERQFAGAGRG